MSTIQSVTIQNELETKHFAKDFSEKLRKGDTVCLYGDLGAGKTTFTRYLVEALGFKDRVMSPTFTLIRKYTKTKKDYHINHIDLYRIESENSLKELGLEELMDVDTITFIEWPERLGITIPKKRYDVFFTIISETGRKIEYQKHE